jgi:hypothetical protein
VSAGIHTFFSGYHICGFEVMDWLLKSCHVKTVTGIGSSCFSYLLYSV